MKSLFDRKLGMFVHWGIYAWHGYHEQEVFRRKMKESDYARIMNEFNPVQFDPDRWIDLVKAAEMEYICFTTKHIDGFCMWDTAETDYKITSTPYGRDTLALLAEACRRRGVKLGLYYSLADMHHVNYPSDGHSYERFCTSPDMKPDGALYMAYVKAQLKELLTGYGEICELFFDANMVPFSDESINDYIHGFQPGCLINDRGPGRGEYFTPEREVPEGDAFTRLTEACQSVGTESWGYRSNEDYYSLKFLEQSVDKILAMGGNYLLNVGPDALGEIPPQAEKLLRGLGDWFRRVGEAFTDVSTAGYLVNHKDWRMRPILLTKRNHVVYVHAAQDLQSERILLAPMETLPLKATLLNDGRAVDFAVEQIPSFWNDKPILRLHHLPVDEFSHEVMVFKLEFDS